MSYSTPASSSAPSRSRRRAVGWESVPIEPGARGRLAYIDKCVQGILRNTNSNEEFRVYYNPFRPEGNAAAKQHPRRPRGRASRAVTASGTHQRWFPSNSNIRVRCAFCNNSVLSTEAAAGRRGRVLKNVFVRPAWSLACDGCASKM